MIEAEKKAMENFYDDVIKNDVQKGVIDRRNWSGFELVNIK